MTTIYVSCDVSNDAYARIVALADATPETDCNFNGADIAVRRDDYTWIDCPENEIAGAQLLRTVHDTIDAA